MQKDLACNVRKSSGIVESKCVNMEQITDECDAVNIYIVEVDKLAF